MIAEYFLLLARDPEVAAIYNGGTDRDVIDSMVTFGLDENQRALILTALRSSDPADYDRVHAQIQRELQRTLSDPCVPYELDFSIHKKVMPPPPPPPPTSS